MIPESKKQTVHVAITIYQTLERSGAMEEFKKSTEGRIDLYDKIQNAAEEFEHVWSSITELSLQDYADWFECIEEYTTRLTDEDMAQDELRIEALRAFYKISSSVNEIINNSKDARNRNKI